ncbi:hypothetical protein VTJ04DRAFT_3884 [Mycothermus thermophilus]|uniref:uncharacterized protein n=1 Tax=Humicola insolens TaxID=85995 RepID=UPI003742CF6A
MAAGTRRRHVQGAAAATAAAPVPTSCPETTSSTALIPDGGARGAENDAATTQPATTSQAPASARKLALHVIVLGSGGGPLENNVTAFLVRSASAGWSNGSVVAVDAGVHLGAIKTILEKTQPANLGQNGGPALPHTLSTGPFAGLEIPYATADANTAYIHKNLIDTYLITHPHLDHLAGFVINTAALGGDRPKKLAGLPSTIAAIKTHIFNNIIWPNLSDENNGAGLVTYQRLVDGGSPLLGEGPGRGYAQMAPGLQVKVMSVSHGHCIERHTHRGTSRHPSFDASSVGQGYNTPSRNLPPTSLPANLGALLQQSEHLQASPGGRRSSAYSIVEETTCVYESSVYFLRSMDTGREILMFGDVEPDSISLSPRNRQVWREIAPKIVAGDLAAIFIECSFDNSQPVDRLFGHLSPRFIVEEMRALAEEVAAVRNPTSGESGLADSATDNHNKKRKRVGDDDIHIPRRAMSTTPQLAPCPDTPLSPGSLAASRRVSVASISEGEQLSGLQDGPGRPSLRSPHPLRGVVNTSDGPPRRRSRPRSVNMTRSLSATNVRGGDDSDLDMASPHPSDASPTSGTAPNLWPGIAPTSSCQQLEAAQHQQQSAQTDLRNALAGLKVVIIHVKNRMSDGVPAQDVILAELLQHEEKEKLGVEYVVSQPGQEFLF